MEIANLVFNFSLEILNAWRVGVPERVLDVFLLEQFFIMEPFVVQ
jgi:hypothetical protein